MPAITFIKTFRYDPTFSGKFSTYRGFCLSGLKATDPGIIDTNTKMRVNKDQRILSSPQLRTIQTAKLMQGVRKIEIHDSLAEIRFALDELVTEDEFIRHGSALVRRRFIDAFIADTLLESRYVLISRVELLLGDICRQDMATTCVSHSFIMKLIEAYLLTNGHIKTDPTLITQTLNAENETYQFGHGFNFKL